MRRSIGRLIIRGKPVRHEGRAYGVVAISTKEDYVEVRLEECQLTEFIAALQSLRSTVCAARKELKN